MEPRCYQCNTLLGDINAACPNCLPNWNRAYAPEVPQPDAPVSWEEQRYLDAQATIAALQEERDGWVRSREHYYQLWMRATDERDEMRKERDEFESQLTQRTAEFQRHDGELQQICGQALGYPWFKDDQKNFPGATEKDGVCVGEHVGITIAQELANAYRKRTAELEAAKRLATNAQWQIDYVLDEAKKAFDLKGHYTPSDLVDCVLRPAASMLKERDELKAELERVSLLSSHNERRFEMLEEKYKELRTLILTLPKVEGEITVSHGYVKDSTRCHALFGADEDAALYAALLQHRQGMEG